MIQIDGSHHDWVEGRGEKCTLPAFIDDATGELTQLRCMPSESSLRYMLVLHERIMRHGVPAALYCDKHRIFRINARRPIRRIDVLPEQYCRAGISRPA